MKRNKRTTLFRERLQSSVRESTYHKTVLSNGVRVISEHLPHVRSVSLGMWITVGSRCENEHNNGITHFIEHVTFKGTRKRSATEIAQSLEQVGGYLNAYTSKEHTCFYARVLDEYTTLAFDVLADLIMNATMKTSHIQKEKQVVLEEIKQSEDEPDDFVHEVFERELYKDHPLHFSILGSTETVSSFTRKHLLEFYRTQYRANNLIIVAAGNIHHETLVNLSEKYFHKLPLTPLLGAKAYQPQPTKRKYRNILYRPIQQAHVCMGTIGLHAKHEKRYILQVLNTLLGEGMSSRLFQTIRERYGLAYSIYSFNSPMSDTGAVGAYIATDANNVDRCIDLVWKEFEKVKGGRVASDELERTKAQLKGSLVLSLESIPNRMIRLASNELYFGDIIPLDTILQAIERVTIDEIVQLTHELYNPEYFVTIIVTPEKSTKTIV
ncbi:MAG: insulinase family protein [Bacteroidetes bacterium]|nr:insulinase family protein [Bacteroidota bacterium]